MSKILEFKHKSTENKYKDLTNKELIDMCLDQLYVYAETGTYPTNDELNEEIQKRAGIFDLGNL